jgi:small subunit ribosomal protein S1
MVDLNLLKEYDVSDEELEKNFTETFGEGNEAELQAYIDKTIRSMEPGNILSGWIVERIGDDVIIDVGLKSEGIIAAHEFQDPSEIVPGEQVEVFLEAIEGDSGQVVLSKRKADRIRGWERILTTAKEDDVVTGLVTRKIKGGLLVDIGVPVFLPASQVDVRRPSDVGEFVGRKIEAKILKIDRERRNIVISRRKHIEDEKAETREKLLEELEPGQICKGVVKNLTDFGAFIDLGGIDGLLHITDMSWGRVNSASEIVSEDQEIEVMVLSIDRDRGKIALGLKQKTPSPWTDISEKYPVGSIIKGEVVNIVNYGAFVKLEEGVEGLVHISEMTWTKRINHPSEVVSVGQEVTVKVLGIDEEKREISLGMKQVEVNPWELVSEKYPPGTVIEGKVRNLTNYGAFIEIEEGIDGLLHVSDISWTKKISHPSEILNKGDTVKCVVLSVDEEKMRISLGMRQMTEDPWSRAVPEKYLPGQIVQGKVTKITSFGAFVELEPDLEGLLHISELSEEKVPDPQSVVKEGDVVEVKILRVDADKRKIGLSLKRAQWAAESSEEEKEERPARQLKGGLSTGEEAGWMGTQKIEFNREKEKEEQPSNEPEEGQSSESQESEGEQSES